MTCLFICLFLDCKECTGGCGWPYNAGCSNGCTEKDAKTDGVPFLCTCPTGYKLLSDKKSCGG